MTNQEKHASQVGGRSKNNMQKVLVKGDSTRRVSELLTHNRSISNGSLAGYSSYGNSPQQSSRRGPITRAEAHGPEDPRLAQFPGLDDMHPRPTSNCKPEPRPVKTVIAG
jgi:hypothetical protein